MAFGYDPGIRITLNPVSKSNGDRKAASSLVGIAKQKAMALSRGYSNRGREFIPLENGGFIDIRFYGTIINIRIDIPVVGVQTVVSPAALILGHDDLFFYRDCEGIEIPATDLARKLVLPEEDSYSTAGGIEWHSTTGSLKHVLIVDTDNNTIIYNGIPLKTPVNAIGESVIRGSTIYILTDKEIYTSSILSSILSLGESFSLEEAAIEIPDGWFISYSWRWNKDLSRTTCVLSKAGADSNTYYSLLHMDIVFADDGTFAPEFIHEDLSAEYSGVVNIENDTITREYTLNGQVIALNVKDGSSPCFPGNSCAGTGYVGINPCLDYDSPTQFIVADYNGVPDICNDTVIIDDITYYWGYAYEYTETIDVHRIISTYEGKSIEAIEYDGNELVLITIEALPDSIVETNNTTLTVVKPLECTEALTTFGRLPYIQQAEGKVNVTSGTVGVEFYRIKEGNKTRLGEDSVYITGKSVSMYYPPGRWPIPSGSAKTHNLDTTWSYDSSVIRRETLSIPSHYNYKYNNGIVRNSTYTIDTSDNTSTYITNSVFLRDGEQIEYINGPHAGELEYVSNDTYKMCALFGSSAIDITKTAYTTKSKAAGKISYDPYSDTGIISTTIYNDWYTEIGIREKFDIFYTWCGEDTTLIELPTAYSKYGFKGQNTITTDNTGKLIDIK